MTATQKFGFGPHYTIDAYGCDPNALSDLSVIYDLMEKITKLIKMNKLGPPILFRVEEKDITYPEDVGITGIIVFAESHFSFHGFPKKEYFSADVFSCKEFDPQIVENELRRVFKFQEAETDFRQRGSKFPRSG